MKKLSAILASFLAVAMLASLPVSAADPVEVCKITEKSADIDGVVSDYEWNDATKLVLNISDTSEWSDDGAGLVGTTGYLDLEHTDEDFYNELSFMADSDYLYILLYRRDSTLNFATDNFRTPYASDCSLMWFYNTDTATQYGLQLLAGDKSQNPHIGYFNGDSNQGSSVDLVESGDATAVTKITTNGYVMEAKIKWSAMDDFNYDMLKSGVVTVTYCCVNICEDGWDSDDGEHSLWGTYNYQAQYKGVNNWDYAPKAELTAQETFAPVVEEPAETEPVTEEPVETPVETPAETPAETPTTTAPVTADAAAVAVFAACVAAAGIFMASRKRK